MPTYSTCGRTNSRLVPASKRRVGRFHLPTRFLASGCSTEVSQKPSVVNHRFRNAVVLLKKGTEMRTEIAALKKVAAASFLVLTCSACMPWIVQKTPTVQGTLEADGHSLSDPALYVVESWKPTECKAADFPALVQAKADGAFTIEGKKGWGAIGYGDYLRGYLVCVRNGDKWYKGYSEGGMGYSMPEVVTLHCEVPQASTTETYICRR